MSNIVVESCDPRDREAEIIDLFTRNGKPDFRAVYERAYRTRAEKGLRSWIGYVDGVAIAHVSVSPLEFRNDKTTVRAGIMGDFMVDENHRDFWTPARLLRSVVADLKKAGETAFLITTTTEEAETVFKAGGFKPFATLRRYVLPLWAPYLFIGRLRSRRPRSRWQSIPRVDDANVGALLPTLHSSAYWRPAVDTAFYTGRIPREGYADGTWIQVEPRRSHDHGYALVSRHGEWREMSLGDGFWGNDGAALADIALAAGRWARKQRYPKLTVATIEESNAARELEKAGFLGRDRVGKLLLQSLGSTAAPPASDWFLTSFVLSSW